MGVITAPGGIPLAFITAILGVEVTRLTEANSRSNGKGIYFNISWPIIPGAPLVASIPFPRY